MKRAEVVELARKAEMCAPWVEPHPGVVQQLERFAALVEKAEREACAEICCNQIHRWTDDRARYAASECAIGIRARGES